MRIWKTFYCLACLAVLVSNLWTMRSWTERTGVWDDLCYLRQAHLFQRFGLDGIDTNIARDDDRYFAAMARDIGYAGWSDPAQAFCHTTIDDKRVIQYPPGTGFVLSMFPEGFQRVPLYIVANLVVFLAALLAIWSARSRFWVTASGLISAVALYFMINPAKSSFSLPPTMIVCAMVGAVTSTLLYAARPSHRIAAAAFVGLLLGLAVSFRVANLILCAGYFAVLLAMLGRSRSAADVLRFVSFGSAYLLGLVPTLIANAVNAGGPLKTTYGAGDTVPLDLSFSIAPQYLVSAQGGVALFAVAWAVMALIVSERKEAAAIVSVNLVTNLLFFFSHPIYTPYYLMPLTALSIWTLLFSFWRSSEQSDAAAQPAYAHQALRAPA